VKDNVRGEKESEDVTARDAEVGAHHTVAQGMTTVEYRYIEVGGAV
jgi:hypothetical protein